MKSTSSARKSTIQAARPTIKRNGAIHRKWLPEDEKAVLTYSIGLLEQHIRKNGAIQKPEVFMLRTVRKAQELSVAKERQRYMTQFRNIGAHLIERLEKEGFPTPVSGKIKHPRQVADIRVPVMKPRSPDTISILPYSMADIEDQLRKKIMGELFEEHCAPYFRHLRLNVKALATHGAALAHRESELQLLAAQIRGEFRSLVAEVKTELEAAYTLLLEEARSGRVEVVAKPPKLPTPTYTPRPTKFSVVIVDEKCQRDWQGLVNRELLPNVQCRFLHHFDNRAAHNEWFLEADRYVLAQEYYNNDTVINNTVRGMKVEAHRIVLFNRDEHTASNLARLSNEASHYAKRV